jgi:hypothetical protein
MIKPIGNGISLCFEAKDAKRPFAGAQGRK